MNGAPFIPPQASILEVSLFGCGVGESLALHLGNGDWVLVDACRANRSDLPLNLAYLYDLGLDPASVVKPFVATHWHDDHIDGAAQIVAHCRNARVAFPLAMTRDEFLRLVSSFAQEGSIVDRERSGVREMGSILKIQSDRRHIDPSSYKPIEMTQADHLLHRMGDCELIAISPSPGSIEKALMEISAMWASLGSGARITLAPPERNHNSIALWIRWGDRRALLGADLEQTGNQQTGWTAALQCRWFPDGKAMIFKIPHHGSPNGDSPEVWSALVESQDPIAILTSYGRGVTPRPSENDLRRISERTSEIYCTTLPKKALPRRERAVERTLAEVTKFRRTITRAAGHIRVLCPESGQPEIALAGAAIKIEQKAA